MPVHLPTATLAILASLAVLALLLASDFAPLEVNNFEQMEGVAGRVRVCCVILNAHPSAKGTVLTLQDVEGGECRAFCPQGLYDQNTSLPATATVIGRVDSDDPRFIFVEELRLQTSL